MADDVLGLRAFLTSTAKEKPKRKLAKPSPAAPNSKTEAGAASLTTATPAQLDFNPDELLDEVKAVFNPKEADWINDENVVTIAPFVEEDEDGEEKRGPKSRWKWVPIRNSSRLRRKDKLEDDLTLHHWRNINKEPQGDYKFSCFDKRLQILHYTDEEYEAHLQHPEWTRTQTDQLFSLCEEYDLRFLIVHDRYNPTPMPQKPSTTSGSNDLATSTNQHPKSSPLASPNPTPTPQSAAFHPRTEKKSMDLDAKIPQGSPTSTTLATPQTPALAQPNASPMVIDVIKPGQNGSSNSLTQGALDMKGDKHQPMKALTLPEAQTTGDNPQVRTTTVNEKKGEASVQIPATPTTPALTAASSARDPQEDADTSRRRNNSRTVEELKDRFYSIQRMLLLIRNGRDTDLKKKHPMFTHEYDMEYERYRRDQLELLQKRTSLQEYKIALTVVAARKLNKRIKMIKRSLSEKNGIRIRTPPVDKDKPTVPSSSGAVKRNVIPKHRLPDTSSSSRKPPTARRVNKFNSPSLTPTPRVPIVEQDVFQEMEEEREVKLAPIPNQVLAKGVIPALTVGVTLRSVQLTKPLSLTGRLLKSLENELVGINLNLKKPRPFAVPTPEVCKLYDQLRTDVVTLMNMRKYIQKKETDRDHLRRRRPSHGKHM
ncbi:hypothetical protein AAMO2058_000630000 [Amorphochlora amoebiformis]